MNDAVKPHRGPLILVIGILSIVVCQFLGIVAWVMANGDLEQMDAGAMDREGRSLTEAGKICGIVGTVFLALGLVWALLAFVVGVGALAFGGGG